MQNSKQQGDVGVAIAIAYYTQKGLVVSVPLTDNARYDLVVETAKGLMRVQCKTTKFIKSSGSYEVALRTSGGNQSWNGEYKKISASECDILFVYSFDGKCYEFLPAEFDGRATFLLTDKRKENNLVWEFPVV